MSKYDPLWKYIKKRGEDPLKLTYAEIEKVTKFPLDHIFLVFKKELLDYGYCVGKISVKEKSVTFDKLTPEEIKAKKSPKKRKRTVAAAEKEPKKA
ncbi:MAG: hypothetical protein MJY99_09410 [Fibrobacter sp.]|uniref:hypothetical protein n=1 Tax=Fibrobacter sp. TaxID=35828 RepID=UPI00388F20C4|nr:hypothetical protein [Fibrobacter sp.]